MNTAANKIKEIISENDNNTSAEVLYKIMQELADSPQSMDKQKTINKTIDMVCEEFFD